MKAHYADVGIVNMIRQQLKDIELQRWLSEINNDTRKDANQSNKMRTYQLFKMIDNYKCEDYLHQVKLAIGTGRYSRLFKKPAERICAIRKIEMAGGQTPFSKDMPSLPGKKTRLFGK